LETAEAKSDDGIIALQLEPTRKVFRVPKKLLSNLI